MCGRKLNLYIYIYILTNLLNNSTYGKRKKNACYSKIKIYNEWMSWVTNMYCKKNKRPTLSRQLKKSTDTQSIGQKKKTPLGVGTLVSRLGETVVG